MPQDVRPIRVENQDDRRGRGAYTILISSAKSTEKQPLLWDEPLRGHGHVRFIIGDLVERLVAERLGGIRRKNDCRCDYCPDVVVDGTRYVECKAVGRSNQVFVYAGRLDKDRRFVELGNDLSYFILRHDVDTLAASTVQQLEAMVVEGTVAMYHMPFAIIDQACSKLPEEKLNSKYGRHGNDQCYGSGFRMTLSLFEAWRIEP